MRQERVRASPGFGESLKIVQGLVRVRRIGKMTQQDVQKTGQVPARHRVLRHGLQVGVRPPAVLKAVWREHGGHLDVGQTRRKQQVLGMRCSHKDAHYTRYRSLRHAGVDRL